MRGRRRGQDPAATSPPAGSRVRRWFVRGFLVGTAVAVPAVFLALVLPAGEALMPFLTPGFALLRPLSPLMASWHGGLGLALGSVVNGLVVGLLAAGVALLLARARR